ncbi:MAG TPA: RnfABCDGE type electron transport complex subunit D [Melioribacteraceae bacterium]|nr:RnfABCDGE type electron transport complex subunit D [Melioribacteraceae bacterium]
METNTVNPSYRLDLTSSPHVHSRWSTKQAMWLVVIALIPALISAVLFFGPYQLIVVATSVAAAVATECFIKLIRKRKITVDDGSAVITGLLLGLILPPNFSLSSTVLGSVFAIAIGKEVFGGLGYNIFNPALAGRAFLQAAFPVAITTWTVPQYAVDTVSSATPLAAYKFDKVLTGIQPMFLGNIGGSIGETSALAILVGGIFLIAVGVVNYRVPAAMIIGMILFAGLLWVIDPVKYPDPLFQIFAGGFLFGTFFMATDWVTSPVTSKGMWVFGIGIALLVVVIRVFGGLPEGVMYAILIMNSVVPIINRYTYPRIFGEAK